MTYNEALFVLRNTAMYDERTIAYAREVVEHVERGSRYDDE